MGAMEESAFLPLRTEPYLLVPPAVCDLALTVWLSVDPRVNDLVHESLLLYIEASFLGLVRSVDF